LKRLKMKFAKKRNSVSLRRVFRKAVKGYKRNRDAAAAGNPENRLLNSLVNALGKTGQEKKEDQSEKKEQMKGIEITAEEGKKSWKKTEDEKRLSMIYPLIPRHPAPNQKIYASANILWSQKESSLVYFVLEPKLGEEEKSLLDKIKNSLIEKFDVDFTKLRKGEAKKYLSKGFEETVRLMAGTLPLEKQENILYYVERDFIGLGRIEPLMQDPNIEDISCDGVGIPIFIYHRNSSIGTLRTNIMFENSEELDSFTNKLAQRSGKTISVASPLVDAALPDGSRIQLTLGTDIARRGSNFCIKEGYVQMHDGSIEDIKELFENWKQKYGSCFDEYKNEICVPVEAYAAGVHQENLEQEKGKVLQILKLPPPEKLVRVSFEECGKALSELEVTKNHMFHVLTEEGIKTVEAEKLNVGMWSPVPAKIDVEGGFSRKEFLDILLDCLSDFGSSRLYIKIDGDARQDITYSGSAARLKDIKRGKITSMPLSDFIKNLEIKGKPISSLESIRCILREGKSGRGSAIRMPLDLTEDFAYFVGWVIGDGSLTRDNVSVHTGLNEAHKNSLMRAIEKLFALEGKTYKNDRNRIYINSGIVSKILHDVFGIPYGNKSRKVDVPKIIQKSGNRLISAFLKGLFEADGSFESSINLTTYSKALATKVIFLLARFGVYSSFNHDGNAFRVYVPSAYYGKFSRVVFSNDKIEKLVAHHKKTKKSNMLPAFLSDVLLKLSKEKGVKWKDISKILNPTEIRKSGKISFRKLEEFNGLLKKYGDAEATKMIDRLLKGDIEFKKISGVKILENKDKSPVYDISCNPVSFYIGGKDRPLFVHDTIRKFTEEPLSPIHMLKFGTANSKILAYLWMLTEFGKSTLIGGSTATGKTTLLNALSLFIKPELKIVTIEDTAELRLPHSHWVPQVARQAITEVGNRKMGEVDMFDLLRESLRQRPDFILVGEVRGKEAYVLFQQIATGHPGIATIHADTIEKLVDRLTTPPIELSPSLIENLDAIIFIERIKYGNKYVRRISSILEVTGFDRENKSPITNEVFKWDPVNDKFVTVNPSIVLRKISGSTGINEAAIQKDIGKRIRILNWLAEKNFTDYRIFANVMKMYYNQQNRLEEIMER